MSGDESPVFVDTNVLVYALAADDLNRSRVAQELVGHLLSAGLLRISTQVIQELYVTLTRKGKSLLSADQALRYLDHLAAWPILTVDFTAIRTAVELSQTARISFWDSLIVVAAVRSGAKRLYTEDLNDGQVILGVEVTNPFRRA
jgi:predicted nucleic acid-binding protein